MFVEQAHLHCLGVLLHGRQITHAHLSYDDFSTTQNNNSIPEQVLLSDSRVKPSSQEHVKDPLLFSQTWPQLLRLGVSHSFTSVLIITRKTDEISRGEDSLS